MSGVDKILLAVGGSIAVAATLCFLPILAALLGAFAGWVVGWFFSETILGIAGQFGIRNIEMWQLGMFLGFVGGFLKTKVSATVKEK